jgi:hypothetical protein
MNAEWNSLRNAEGVALVGILHQEDGSCLIRSAKAAGDLALSKTQRLTLAAMLRTPEVAAARTPLGKQEAEQRRLDFGHRGAPGQPKKRRRNLSNAGTA